MKRHISLICLAACIAGVSAQDLRTEITVDRTVQPVLRGATRISGVTPSILSPEVKQKSLSTAEYSEGGTLESEISILPAAAWADSITHTPYRGYAMIGYLPMFNLGGSAGYRFIDTKRTSLGLWLQYDGDSYKSNLPHYEDATFTNHAFTVGGNLGIRFTKNSLFTGSGYATMRTVGVPYFMVDNTEEIKDTYHQRMRSIYGQGRWSSRTGNLVYALSGELSYFDLGKQRPKFIRTWRGTIQQATAKGALSIGYADDDSTLPWIGIDADYEILRTRGIPRNLNGLAIAYKTENIKTGNIRPYLRFDNDNGLQGTIGLKVSLGSGYGTKTMIAPDVKIGWAPASPVKVWINATGGQYLNLMKDIFEINPYIDPSIAYGASNLPLVVRGGINVGPYEGMELSLHGGYAMARQYLSPLITIMRTGLTVSSMQAQDVDSWYIGAHLGYAYHDIFSLGFDIKYGKADKDTHSWYEWIDAPKVVSNVNLTITPIDALDIELDYNMRYDRKATSLVYPFNKETSVMYVGIPNLGTVNDVNVNLTYRINSQLSAFAHVENVLNNRTTYISAMESPGIHGLVGVAYKF